MTKINKKPTIFSGIKPSGNVHIGNYLGAITQWAKMQDDHNCIFCVVDYHAITVKQDPKMLKKRIFEIVKVYLASGIDPKKSIIFQQSDISAHTEMAWIMNCVARMSDLKKMTQFKDKAGENQENVSVGLFDYPALMAADILLYNTEVVPVGDDQVQHVELTRDLAKRFNSQFGETFRVPEAKINKESARIMSLDDPARKMGKSESSEYNRIELLDEPAKAAKKIMRAVTDTGKDILYDKLNKPGITNLMSMYSILAEMPIRDIEKKYKRKGYGDFKKDLADIVKKFLADFQKKYNAISDKDVYFILSGGAERARPIAEETLKRVKEKLGIN
ncbi:tryptophan--tRNA ligase [Candidatus Falkowbacteria bacterium RIFOXYB2_FULL_47_14]|uniref:Tryptophan--tRNA ligase n=1 Tax=Candidatus Falkowbacteria bacterium RIFOXYA2_FULL_47_19 TaxID=1797994 RepID=A0A1F5SFV8_9BACT|nr:MAG: tryptophan--tRNA ligase [Candidatus Falkowbacteria bacterium RIFOXYA2_FULL_47_19]OGF35603.1 MAG: tryptophan--tRNA ligase [Candidatus Falkowbacteria bacterium RIFOXYC2_FULL_46_15]OGF42913.1 MAG: tryptophan--tRNA ligase [Candidatus Falkowbacteria bacterium RIFOXYB2_FULL_47_14]